MVDTGRNHRALARNAGMRPIPALGMVFSLGAGLLAPLPATAAETIIVNGVARSFEIFVPSSATLPAPAMVLLHGGGGSAGQLRGHLDFDDLAASAGVVVLYPDSVDGLWNDGRISPTLADRQAASGDDVAFIAGLVDAYAAGGVIDPARVGVAGISNGGMMTLRLACEAPYRFTAFAVVVANVAVGVECPGGPAVPMMFIHGTEDSLVPYDGGTIAPQFGNRGTALSVADSLALWAARNGCSGRNTHATLNNRPLDGTVAYFFDYTGCRANLRHIVVVGGGHAWPGKRQGLIGLVTGRATREFDGDDAIWAFVTAQFPR